MTGRSERAGNRLISSLPSPPGRSRSSRTSRGLSVRMRCASFSGSPLTAGRSRPSRARCAGSIRGSSSTTRMRAGSAGCVSGGGAAAAPACLSKSRGSSSGATPRRSSEPVRATCPSSRAAATRIGDDSGACRAVLAKRLPGHLRDAPPVGHRGRQAGGECRPRRGAARRRPGRCRAPRADNDPFRRGRRAQLPCGVSRRPDAAPRHFRHRPPAPTALRRRSLRSCLADRAVERRPCLRQRRRPCRVGRATLFYPLPSPPLSTIWEITAVPGSCRMRRHLPRPLRSGRGAPQRRRPRRGRPLLDDVP